MQTGKFSDKRQVKLFLSSASCSILDDAAKRTGLSRSLIVDMILQGSASGKLTVTLDMETGNK